MKATQAFRGQFLSKRCFGKKTLRECSTTGKTDNIVLIEVDCDDLGDVIILDVPESFQEKFRKNSEHHVIKIDDEDGNDSSGGVSDMEFDATASNRSSPNGVPTGNCANMDSSTNGFPRASEACSSNCVDVDEDCLFVNEGNIPVKLSKSKRTYSGKTVSENQCGSKSESLSEGDCSDCEFMEGSFGKLREQWEKASFNRRRGTSCHRSDVGDKAGSPAKNQPVHHRDEGVAGLSEPASWESDSCAVNCENNVQTRTEEYKFFQKEINNAFTGRHDSCSASSDFEKKDMSCAPDQFVHGNSEGSAAEHVEFPNDCCFSSPVEHDGYVPMDDPAEHLAEKTKHSQRNCVFEGMGKLFTGDYSTNSTKETTCQDFRNYNPQSIDTEQDVGRSFMFSETSICGHKSESKSSLDQNNIITDRQMIKETDEYKRAMEEEWASRQRQLQRQAEEAQRLRSRKRAEKMRIMDHERRQKQRLEEIRETRRKDEENSNLKDMLRVEIKKELRRLEMACGDMASLLRCLGIHVGGGPWPSPSEVQAAYKRACLKFHPDRLSTTDLRQQVEAEEKFKLISNMKEKFSM